MAIPFLAKRRASPYAIILIVLVVAADIGGVVHAFRMHGTRDGVIALVLPPFGLYRAIESIKHTSRPVIDPTETGETDAGRRSAAEGLHLTPRAWSRLLTLIAAEPGQQVRTTMQETGVQYDITAAVPRTGPIILTIQDRTNPDLTISMVDANRDQDPETLHILRKVKGVTEVHDTPIAKYSSADASQFLLAWTLAWGTIAQENLGARGGA